jgi:hypothetical protein
MLLTREKLIICHPWQKSAPHPCVAGNADLISISLGVLHEDQIVAMDQLFLV